MILYTLDNNYYKKRLIIYIIFSVIVGVFAFIYEMFSHNVYSNYMIYAFLIPLLLGVISSICFIFFKVKLNNMVCNLIDGFISTMTIYSIMRGVLDIYGTSNSLINVYLIMGVMLLLMGVFVMILPSKEIDNK